MAKALELTGQRFGRLTVIKRIQNDGHNNSRWECRCICGELRIVAGRDLKSGHTESCGCLRRERLLESITTHGDKHTSLYKRWVDMRQRCSNPKNTHFRQYGGRGITVCDEWRDSYEAFRDWALTNGYRDDLTIDRINVDGNYCPENCRWVSRQVQASNKQNSKIVEYNERPVTLRELSKLTGIKYNTLLWRYNHGYRGNQLLEEA